MGQLYYKTLAGSLIPAGGYVINDTTKVSLSGNETINGNKTFTGSTLMNGVLTMNPAASSDEVLILRNNSAYNSALFIQRPVGAASATLKLGDVAGKYEGGINLNNAGMGMGLRLDGSTTSAGISFYSGNSPGAGVGTTDIGIRAKLLELQVEKVQLKSPGATGGLEFGSSGPRMMMGTGSPSGVTAPIGSTWRQTNANSTYGSLTGLLWNKVGSGTVEGTDWLVDFEGRWITWSPSISNITQGSSPVLVAVYTRRGKEATFDFMLRMGAGGAVTGDPSFTLPVARTQTSPAGERAWHAFIRTDTDYFPGWAYMSGGSTVTIYPWRSLAYTNWVGGYGSVSSLPGPWTGGNGRFHVSGTYEIA